MRWKTKWQRNKERLDYLESQVGIYKKWFAWRPVTVQSDNKRYSEVCWLEWVERKILFVSAEETPFYQYRFILERNTNE